MPGVNPLQLFMQFLQISNKDNIQIPFFNKKRVRSGNEENYFYLSAENSHLVFETDVELLVWRVEIHISVPK